MNFLNASKNNTFLPDAGCDSSHESTQGDDFTASRVKNIRKDFEKIID